MGFASFHNWLMTTIYCRMYHRSCFTAISTLVHRCEKLFSTFRGCTKGDSAQGVGSKAGTGRDRIGWGPIAGTE